MQLGDHVSILTCFGCAAAALPLCTALVTTCVYCLSSPSPQLLLPQPAALKNTVRRGEVLVNGKASRRPDTPIQLGDQVSVVTRVGCSAAAAPFHRQTLKRMLPGLDVAYEDEHMAVVVKPQVRRCCC
jgi:hypothetical protein